jgi:hypothetical protein
MSFPAAHETKLMRLFVIAWLVIVCTAGPARADDWTQTNNTWSYNHAISVDVPSAFNATLNGQTLQLTARGGAVTLTFLTAHGQTELDTLVRTMNQTLSAKKATMKAQSHTVEQQGVEMAFKEGAVEVDSVPFDVTIVVMGREEDFVMCQLLMPKALTAEVTADLDSLFSTVREAKNDSR